MGRSSGLIFAHFKHHHPVYHRFQWLPGIRTASTGLPDSPSSLIPSAQGFWNAADCKKLTAAFRSFGKNRHRLAHGAIGGIADLALDSREGNGMRTGCNNQGSGSADQSSCNEGAKGGGAAMFSYVKR